MIVNQKKIQDREMGNNASTGYESIGYTQARHISFYDQPPQDVIGIYEFQNIAVSRLQVLKKIQFLYDANNEGAQDLMTHEINKYSRQHRLNIEGIIDPDMSKGISYTKIKKSDLEQALKNDNISHFICRLAYCRNDDLRRWYVMQETRLFYHRLQPFEADEVLRLLKEKCQMNYDQLSEKDEIWQKHKDKITFNEMGGMRHYPQINIGGVLQQKIQAENYVKVPFKDSLSLVHNKQVWLHKGFAYVHIQDLKSIAKSQFRAKLMQELIRAYKYLPTILRDTRLSKMLIDLSNHNAIDFNLTEVSAPKDTDKIKLADLDFYSRQSFPPCMKALFMALKNHHHLKHFGRL